MIELFSLDAFLLCCDEQKSLCQEPSLVRMAPRNPSYMEDCRKSFIMTLHVDFSLFFSAQITWKVAFFSASWLGRNALQLFSHWAGFEGFQLKIHVRRCAGYATQRLATRRERYQWRFPQKYPCLKHFSGVQEKLSLFDDPKWLIQTAWMISLRSVRPFFPSWFLCRYRQHVVKSLSWKAT